MDTIDYFKLQAKNLHRDFKTKTPVFDKTINDFLYEYTPKYFQIDELFRTLILTKKISVL